MKIAPISTPRLNFKSLGLIATAVLATAISLGGCAEAEEDATDNAVTDTTSGEATATAEEALRYPGGSWTLTCPDRTVRYDSNQNPAQIIAYCYNRSHKLVRNTVWVWDCSTGCYWNNNGKLTCGNC